MNENLVYALNETSGVVGEVPAHYLTHPVLGANLRPMRTGKPVASFMEPAFPRTQDELDAPTGNESDDELEEDDTVESADTDEKED